MTTLESRLQSVAALMQRNDVERLILLGNGHHMIDLDNPVAHMTGYRSVGPAMLMIEADGSQHLLTQAG